MNDQAHRPDPAPRRGETACGSGQVCPSGGRTALREARHSRAENPHDAANAWSRPGEESICRRAFERVTLRGFPGVTRVGRALHRRGPPQNPHDAATERFHPGRGVDESGACRAHNEQRRADCARRLILLACATWLSLSAGRTRACTGGAAWRRSRPVSPPDGRSAAQATPSGRRPRP